MSGLHEEHSGKTDEKNPVSLWSIKQCNLGKLVTLFIWLVTCITSINPRIKNENPFMTKKKTQENGAQESRVAPQGGVESTTGKHIPCGWCGSSKEKMESQRGGRGGGNFKQS